MIYFSKRAPFFTSHSGIFFMEPQENVQPVEEQQKVEEKVDEKPKEKKQRKKAEPKKKEEKKKDAKKDKKKIESKKKDDKKETKKSDKKETKKSEKKETKKSEKKETKKKVKKESKKSKFSMFAQFVAEAIKTNMTEESQFVSYEKIKRYTFDYLETAMPMMIPHQIRLAIDKLVVKGLLKKKKDSYAFKSKAEGDFIPEKVPTRKLQKRETKEEPEEEVKAPGTFITQTGRVSKKLL